jgi:hypothetical protein
VSVGKEVVRFAKNRPFLGKSDEVAAVGMGLSVGIMKWATLDANEAVASVAYRLGETIAIYPITPSSPMAEWCDEWTAKARPNLGNTVPHLVQMQSEVGVAGADVVQMASALLKHGPEHLGTVLEDLRRWLEDHEYESLDQLRGSMSLRARPDPAAFERANDMRILQTWRV